MHQYFELFLQKEDASKEDWQAFYDVVSQQAGPLNQFKIIVSLQDNTVRYFVACFKDLAPLSNKLTLGILKPVTEEDVDLPKSESIKEKERLLPIQPGESLLDIRERFQIKKSKDLDFAVFTIRRINKEKALTKLDLIFKDTLGEYSINSRRLTVFPTNLPAVNFSDNTKYLRSSVGRYLDIQKTLGIMQSENVDAIFETYTFPYLPKNYYLPLTSYDFDKHSLIVGASGSGKSKLITLITERIATNQMLSEGYSIVVIDPHASLEEDLTKVNGSITIDFKDENQDTGLFSGSESDVQAATELTSTLFKSLLEGQNNAQLERVLKHSVYMLITAQVMSLDNLKRFVTDLEYRTQLINHVKDYVPETLIHFFSTDFNDIRTQYYNVAISPIVTFVEEIQLQPALSGSSGDEESSIADIVNKHNVTVFSLNKISMGEKAVKITAGLLIQQIFLLAQSRSFNKKVILIIDEVSVVQNPTIASILSEARKYNLSVILTQQYFGQIDKPLQEAVFANVFNYYVFKVSEEDAKNLEGNLSIDIPKEILEAEKNKGLNQRDVRVQMLTSLHPRELLLRLSAAGKILPCIKGRTMDFTSISSPQQSIELQPAKKSSAVPTKFVESKDPIAGLPAMAPQEPSSIPILSPIRPTDPTVGEIIEHAQNPIQTPVQAEPKKVSMSLHDLLASQSSARKIRK